MDMQRFKILDEDFDRGGFGKIIVVNDEILERKVAIKKLKYLDEENKNRFIKEAKILASLTYPNIPAIYDINFSDTEMIILFQFIEGSNLRKIISQKFYPSMEEARKWFRQIALSLDYAHSKGVLHRDIKPENIIISDDRSTAYLVDFGIALDSEDTRSRYSLIGTPGYMAPEYISDGKLLDASDIFSLGVTLYESLTGLLPVYDQYISISDSNESISPAVDDLIKRCIVKDPASRLQTAKEFNDLLNNSLRLDVPFSSILTDSRLFEIQQALKNMSADEFHAKPLGQRLLVISRIKDLVKVKSQDMLAATAELLKVMINLCIYEEKEEFSFIFSSSLYWGFEMQFGDRWVGDVDLRAGISNTCKFLKTENHKYASESLINFIESNNLAEKPKWYLHDLRPIVMSLLSNPNAKSYARELAKLYENINEFSHKYTTDSDAEA